MIELDGTEGDFEEMDTEGDVEADDDGGEDVTEEKAEEAQTDKTFTAEEDAEDKELSESETDAADEDDDEDDELDDDEDNATSSGTSLLEEDLDSNATTSSTYSAWFYPHCPYHWKYYKISSQRVNHPQQNLCGFRPYVGHWDVKRRRFLIDWSNSRKTGTSGSAVWFGRQHYLCNSQLQAEFAKAKYALRSREAKKYAKYKYYLERRKYRTEIYAFRRSWYYFSKRNYNRRRVKRYQYVRRRVRWSRRRARLASYVTRRWNRMYFNNPKWKPSSWWHLCGCNNCAGMHQRWSR